MYTKLATLDIKFRFACTESNLSVLKYSKVLIYDDQDCRLFLSNFQYFLLFFGKKLYNSPILCFKKAHKSRESQKIMQYTIYPAITAGLKLGAKNVDLGEIVTLQYWNNRPCRVCALTCKANLFWLTF